MKKLKQDEEQIACIPFHIDSMHRRELPGSLECKVKTSLFWKNRFRYWKLPGCIQCGIELICSELDYLYSTLKMARIGMPKEYWNRTRLQWCWEEYGRCLYEISDMWCVPCWRVGWLLCHICRRKQAVFNTWILLFHTFEKSKLSLVIKIHCGFLVEKRSEDHSYGVEKRMRGSIHWCSG